MHHVSLRGAREGIAPHIPPSLSQTTCYLCIPNTIISAPATYGHQAIPCWKAPHSRSSLIRRSARALSGDPRGGISGLWSGNSSSRRFMITVDSVTTRPSISMTGRRPPGTCYRVNGKSRSMDASIVHWTSKGLGLRDSAGISHRFKERMNRSGNTISRSAGRDPLTLAMKDAGLSP